MNGNGIGPVRNKWNLQTKCVYCEIAWNKMLETWLIHHRPWPAMNLSVSSSWWVEGDFYATHCHTPSNPWREGENRNAPVSALKLFKRITEHFISNFFFVHLLLVSLHSCIWTGQLWSRIWFTLNFGLIWVSIISASLPSPPNEVWISHWLLYWLNGTLSVFSFSHSLARMLPLIAHRHHTAVVRSTIIRTIINRKPPHKDGVRDRSSEIKTQNILCDNRLCVHKSRTDWLGGWWV